MATRYRPSEETKIRRAAIRAERARLRKQIRRAYLNKITAAATETVGVCCPYHDAGGNPAWSCGGDHP